jgi:hypothetical protein
VRRRERATFGRRHPGVGDRGGRVGRSVGGGTVVGSGADGSSFREFRDECREAKLRAADDQAITQRLHETRAVRTWSDGHWRLEAQLRPDEGARVNQVLEHKTNELFVAARAEGRREAREAYRADALVALLTGEVCERPIELRLEGDYAGQGHRLQIDHIIAVTGRGPTSEENLWRLCPHHHTLKTIYGWRVVIDEHGIRNLIPPDDPDPP